MASSSLSASVGTDSSSVRRSDACLPSTWPRKRGPSRLCRSAPRGSRRNNSSAPMPRSRAGGGDLFDRAHVAPVFREMVRRDVIEPLGAAGIEVWILAGNHDQPRRAVRSTSLDDYRGYSHVKVFRNPKMEIREFDGRKIGFILI